MNGKLSFSIALLFGLLVGSVMTGCGDDEVSPRGPGGRAADEDDPGRTMGGSPSTPDEPSPDPDANGGAGGDGDAAPVLVPVVGNVDPDLIDSFARVSFVLEDGEYSYFRVFEGDTFVSAVTSSLAVGRFVNENGTLDSFVLDLATQEARVFRLPDATDVWITDANEAGVIVGNAARVRPGDTEPTTFAFRHDLATGTTTETFLGSYSGYEALREDGSALLTSISGEGRRQYLEDATGLRTEVSLRGFEAEFLYLGLAGDGRIFGIRSDETKGGVVSTLSAKGLNHQFIDVTSPTGSLYPTTLFSIDHDGVALVRYEVPIEGVDSPEYRYGTLSSLEAEPVSPPLAHPVFLDPALAVVQYGGLRWGRAWGTATYYGE